MNARLAVSLTVAAIAIALLGRSARTWADDVTIKRIDPGKPLPAAGTTNDPKTADQPKPPDAPKPAVVSSYQPAGDDIILASAVGGWTPPSPAQDK